MEGSYTYWRDPSFYNQLHFSTVINIVMTTYISLSLQVYNQANYSFYNWKDPH